MKKTVHNLDSLFHYRKFPFMVDSVFHYYRKVAIPVNIVEASMANSIT